MAVALWLACLHEAPFGMWNENVNVNADSYLRWIVLVLRSSGEC